MTSYQKKLKQKYLNMWGDMDQGYDFYLYMYNAPEQYGVEENVIEFMNKNPNATFKELLEYVDTQIPNIEIVDEDIEDE